jgi:hypothetical protein
MEETIDEQWEQMFGHLIKFKEQYGHCFVPKRHPLEQKLSSWVCIQRSQLRKLSESEPLTHSNSPTRVIGAANEDDLPHVCKERFQRLSEIGFAWSFHNNGGKPESSRNTRNSLDDNWDSMFKALVAYKNQHGHCLVPKRYKDDPKLGTWVDTQRVQYKKLKRNFISPLPLQRRITSERIQRLEELGFVWSIRNDWHKRYDELKKYKAEQGNCNVPARYVNNRPLGIWVSAQRKHYKLMNAGEISLLHSTPLTQERTGLLDELGFVWKVRCPDICGR